MTTCSMYTWMYTCVATVMWGQALISGTVTATCQCANHQGCMRPSSLTSTDKEVYIVTDGSSNYKEWKWESFTSVLVTMETTKPNNDLMCYTHQMKKKYGIMHDLELPDSGNLTEVTEKNVQTLSDNVKSMSADILVINLMDIFVKLTAHPDITLLELENFMEKLHKELQHDHRNPTELICVVPWQPQCKDTTDCSFTESTLFKTCDFLLIDPSSFALTHGYVCKARAGIPFTKLPIGIDEYVGRGFKENRIILGIPWHGYTYSCRNRFANIDVGVRQTKYPCLLGNNTDCDIRANRKLITSGELMKTHQYELNHAVFHKAFKAPMFNHFDNITRKWQQTWYENFRSLRLKYKYAHDFDLRGVAIYRAEDLAEPVDNAMMGFNGGMWNWVLHGIIQTNVKLDPPVQHPADVVAGISIGCLILGVVLGVMFTCLALRHRVKKRQPPFRSDQSDYHDEDDDFKL